MFRIEVIRSILGYCIICHSLLFSFRSGMVPGVYQGYFRSVQGFPVFCLTVGKKSLRVYQGYLVV